MNPPHFHHIPLRPSEATTVHLREAPGDEEDDDEDKHDEDDSGDHEEDDDSGEGYSE
jgi:hypothetical protein